MKILVVTQYFYPETFRVNTLCRELVERGHSVTVLTGYPQYPIGRLYDGYGFNKPYEKEWHGVKIERVKTYPRGKTPLGLLNNCISYVRSANAWVDKCTERFDAVYVFEVSPVTVGLPAVTYKKKFKTPIFFNLQDLWPENVHEVLGIKFAPLTWFINKIVDKIYANSDKILCSSNGFVDNLGKRGVEKEKLVYWPQFCIEPDLSNMERPEIYKDSTFNIVFTGNIGDAQGLDLMVQAAAELKDSNIRWFLVGDGRARARLEKQVEELHLQDIVFFVGRVNEAEANRYVNFADCAYLSFKNNELFNMTIPAKLQTYLSCGTPILAAAGGESAQIINGACCGIAVNPELKALVEAAKKMSVLSKEEKDIMAYSAKEYYRQNFTMKKLVNQLENLMKQ